MLDIHKYYNDYFRMLFNMLEKHIIFAKVKLKIVIVFIERNNKTNISEYYDISEYSFYPLY